MYTPLIKALRNIPLLINLFISFCERLLIKSQIIQSSLSQEAEPFTEARNFQCWQIYPHLSSLNVRPSSTSPPLHLTALSPSIFFLSHFVPTLQYPSLSLCSLWRNWWESVPLQCLTRPRGYSPVSTSSNKLKIENETKIKSIQSEPMQLHVPSEEVARSRSSGCLDDSAAVSGSKGSPSCICR